MAKANIIPTMRYQDAPAMIEWLCSAFGFEKRLVVPGEGRVITHAELTLGNGMIMLGSERDDAFGKLLSTARAAGTVTQSAYVVVPDARAHYERAKAAGAEIVDELREESYGGAVYAARDPEGQLWYFGSYDPWA
jgi:uncharacterized glyoxalase superfamily protein PhnB